MPHVNAGDLSAEFGSADHHGNGFAIINGVQQQQQQQQQHDTKPPLHTLTTMTTMQQQQQQQRVVNIQQQQGMNIIQNAVTTRI